MSFYNSTDKHIDEHLFTGICKKYTSFYENCIINIGYDKVCYSKILCVQDEAGVKYRY